MAHDCMAHAVTEYNKLIHELTLAENDYPGVTNWAYLHLDDIGRETLRVLHNTLERAVEDAPDQITNSSGVGSVARPSLVAAAHVYMDKIPEDNVPSPANEPHIHPPEPGWLNRGVGDPVNPTPVENDQVRMDFQALRTRVRNALGSAGTKHGKN